MLLAIREHPAIFVAAVNGFALGGGATLISMCDLAIAAEEAEIGMPEIGFGAYPQFSGPAAQIQLTPKRAAWLVLTAERIDGRTAEAWGMVNRSVALDRLMAEAERWPIKIESLRSRRAGGEQARSGHCGGVDLRLAAGLLLRDGHQHQDQDVEQRTAGGILALLRRANAISDKEERARCPIEPIQDRLDSGRA